MKYVITGSTGHISKPLAQQLVAAGHQVTIITSSAAKTDEIKQLGATPAVGSVEDLDFLTRTFAGADAVYLLVPPNLRATDFPAYQQQVSNNYVDALKNSSVKHAVLLSSIGAHMGKGAGPVDGVAYLEKAIAKLDNVNTVALRPSYFYYNLFGQIGMIKNAGFVGSTQPADFKLVLTHTNDIADAAAELLLNPTFSGHTVKYLASDDTHTWADITAALGKAIGKTDLPFVQLTDEQFMQGLQQAGLNEDFAAMYATMGKALRSGNMQEEYWQQRPTSFGKVKLEDFAQEFAGAYNAAV